MILYISCTLNNTLVRFAGDWSSGGRIGLKNSQKGGVVVAERVGKQVGDILKKGGVREVSVKLKGITLHGLAVLKGLRGREIEILKVEDRTPIPHNGCRLPKKRRV